RRACARVRKLWRNQRETVTASEAREGADQSVSKHTARSGRRESGLGGLAISLDLSAVHHPAGCRVERVAARHRAAIVPKHEIADPPSVSPRELLPCGMGPDFVKQRV